MVTAATQGALLSFCGVLCPTIAPAPVSAREAISKRQHTRPNTKNFFVIIMIAEPFYTNRRAGGCHGRENVPQNLFELNRERRYNTVIIIEAFCKTGSVFSFAPFDADINVCCFSGFISNNYDHGLAPQTMEKISFFAMPDGARRPRSSFYMSIVCPTRTEKIRSQGRKKHSFWGTKTMLS